MIPCKTIKELRRQFADVHSGVAGDTIFGAKALMFIAERLEANGSKPKPHRKPSKWQKFLGSRLRAGKSVQEAAKEWRAR